MRKSRHSAPPPLTAAFDRGPAKYFHGRKEILRNFHELVENAVQTKTGTTFLIQGAPGAGKSALLEECEKRGLKMGWETAEIKPPALWEPDELRQSLGLRKFPNLLRGSIKFGFLEAAGTVDLSSKTMEKLLRKGKKPLLLTLDEAQTLGTTNAPPSNQSGTVTNVLNAIHNGRLNRPVILISAGLGTTVKAFKSLGISRFSGKCFVELGALSKEAERAVIHDWLTKDGGAKGDPKEWIHAIAQETHGWPQHILSYAEPAARHLRDKDGLMNADGLKIILETGRRLRSDYYERRLDDFRGDQIRCLARLVAGIPPDEPVEYKDIESSLTTEYGEKEAKQLFQGFLENGILTRRGFGYTVPIPSMHYWLEHEYAHI